MAQNGADAGGCLGTALGIALVLWIPLHFAGKALLYYRETSTADGMLKGQTYVKCHYLSSTGLIETANLTPFPNQFFCPRMKSVVE